MMAVSFQVCPSFGQFWLIDTKRTRRYIIIITHRIFLTELLQ